MMKAFMLLGDLSTKQGNELSDEAVAYKERIALLATTKELERIN